MTAVRFWLLPFLFVLTANAEVRMEPWNAETVRAGLEREEAYHPYPTYQQREAWERWREMDVFADDYAQILEDAAKLARQDPPFLRASDYLDYQRTGRRTLYQNILSQRHRFLATLALAECLQGEGKFLDPLIDILWAYCEESDWSLPAHTDGLVNFDNPPIDLRATVTAAEMAFYAYIFGDALPERVQMRIRFELERRIFSPYEKQDDFFWLTSTHNWNSVCNGNIVTAALYQIDDADRLARIVTKAQNAMTHYLNGFGKDGGTAEGLGYWSYGFSYYVEAGKALRNYSNGRLDLFAPPIVRDVALLPMRVELSPMKYPSFSDGGDRYRFSAPLLSYLADVYQSEALRTFAARYRDENLSVSSVDGLVKMMVDTDLPEPSDSVHYEPFTFLSGIQWMISRVDPQDPMGLVVAAKGGRNNEPHNHNDVGSFIVHYKGESILTDLGAAVYDRGFFSSKRYEYWAARSLGHPVPLVNGKEQRDGGGTEAVAAATHDVGVDVLQSDITSAYPAEAGLKQLVRTVKVLRDGKGVVEVIDQAEFNEKPESFETALMTYAEVERVDKTTLVVRGTQGALRVQVLTEGAAIHIDEHDARESKLRVGSDRPMFRRIAIRAMDAQAQTQLHYRIEPMD
ncbi:MAG: heparinase II/III family protein [Candidatus Hinthialibacter antarcticus]|nr:heparinase II/III family protein [Candidatus Hinthialibacter antarcticus]